MVLSSVPISSPTTEGKKQQLQECAGCDMLDLPDVHDVRGKSLCLRVRSIDLNALAGRSGISGLSYVDPT